MSTSMSLLCRSRSSIRTLKHTSASPSSGARAEKVAAGAELTEGIGFQKARRLVREALVADGVAGDIEELVSDLLAPVALGV